jgi:hypothetical protein
LYLNDPFRHHVIQPFRLSYFSLIPLTSLSSLVGRTQPHQRFGKTKIRFRARDAAAVSPEAVCQGSENLTASVYVSVTPDGRRTLVCFDCGEGASGLRNRSEVKATRCASDDRVLEFIVMTVLQSTSCARAPSPSPGLHTTPNNLAHLSSPAYLPVPAIHKQLTLRPFQVGVQGDDGTVVALHD